MTKQELIKELEIAQTLYGNDNEVSHSVADSLLLAFINDEEIEKAYDDVPKWYA